MKFFRKAKQAAVVAIMSFLSSPVLAGGASLPWDTPMTILRNKLTGPFPASIAIGVFVAVIATLIFESEDMSGIDKGIWYIVLGVCIVVFGLQFLSVLGIFSSGA